MGAIQIAPAVGVNNGTWSGLRVAVGWRPAEVLHGRVPGRGHTLAAHDHLHGARQDRGVEAERPMVDVPDVVFELLLPRERVAPVHLRPPGDAGPHVVTTRLLGCVERQVLDEEWTRP